MKKKKILLVEDEFVVASDIEECLETSGYIVSGIISDGETAITKIEKNRPDLVMMDIKLNGKLSGTETAAIVKTRFNIPVIYLSAFSQESIMTQVRDSEPFGYLKKPFREKELLMALEIAFCRDSNEKKLFKQLQDSRELTKESERSLHQKVKVIQLLQEVIIASNEAKTVEEVMQLCLDDVCNFMNWPVGHLYTVDSKGTLVSSKIWHFKNAEKFKAFRKVTENTSFDRGVGLPGRVLASGKPVWVSDVTLDRNFPRAKLVKNLGIKAGFAFPVLEGQKVVSVLEFFSTEAMEPAEIILEALSNFAVQVGRVSERKKAEEEIKRYRDHLEKEVDKRTQELDFQKNTLDEHAIVSATDSNGNITYANDKFCAISGYKRDEVMGQNHRIIKSDEHPPEFYRDMWNTISNGKVWHGELKNKKKNGDYYWVKATMAPCLDESGKPYQYISIRTDITDHKKAEKELNKFASEMEQLAEERSKQLIHLDRMATLGTLSAGVAHEINNPVGFVSNNLQIFEKLWNQRIRASLEKANRDNEDKILSFALDEMPEIVKSMKEGVTRITNIVRGLSKFSRKTKIAFWPSNICEVIEAAVNFCRLDVTVKHKVKIELDLPDDIPFIKISRQEIEQVLINLITNSCHAMEEIKDGKELILKITVYHVSNKVVIEITDNGHGIDEKTLNNVFDPFFTTKDIGKGTGLGLSICRGIIEQHRGNITVSSTLGKGTTFTIKLPINPEIEERREKSDKKIIGGMRNED